jgi:hypothetical protein
MTKNTASEVITGKKSKKKVLINPSQCDQIGQNLAIWATLGYFLLNQFSPKQAVSTHDLL